MIQVWPRAKHRWGRRERLRTLIVDDSPIALETMALFMECHAGYKLVGMGHNGQEGVELATSLHPDLVLMDLQMPVMNGLDAARLIKQQADAPVVVLVSIEEGMAYRAAAQTMGADGFVGKMAIATELPELLERLFHSKAEGLALGGASVPASLRASAVSAREEAYPTLEGRHLVAPARACGDKDVAAPKAPAREYARPT